jgi:curli biogenesis system outer membrane secretion channel CsgG
MTRSLFFFVILTFFSSYLQADDNQPSVFVAPLDGDLSQIQGWQPAMGEGLAEMLITELSKTGKFTVLESTALNSLKDEIKLGEDGYVGKDEKVDKGGFAGADFMFRGKVTRFGSKAQNINLGGFVPGSGGNLGVKTSKSDVRIDWRFVDAATRKIITSGQAVGEENGLGFNIGVGVNGHGGNIGFGNQEFMNSALGKATVKAIDTIMEQVSTVTLPTSGRQKAKAAAKESAAAQQNAAADALRNSPGQVLAVPSPNVVIVSLGSKQGFKMGDKLHLYETVDTKDAQGNVVFTDEKLVGEVILDTVQEDRSKASYNGQAPIKQGWKVKLN